MKRIIGFAGKKGVGKDTASDFLETYKKTSWSASLKSMLAFATKLPPEYFTDTELKDTELSMTHLLSEEDVMKIIAYTNEKLIPLTQHQQEIFLDIAPGFSFKKPRELMQFVGTNLFRNFVGRDYWVKVFSMLNEKEEALVISDVRFPEEHVWIKERGGIVVLIENEETSNDNHVSENSLGSRDEYDATIINKYSMMDLGQSVKTIAKLYELICEGRVYCG